ncbi:hypothetical protein [Enterococcus faecalis]|uniref:hypothetical protein n=2 Tax=Enterococcus faecalis TaxID=1351 RepID=UPI0001F0B9BA|nr:hypothetical protein [Enterococcus faecalis]EFT47189.1 hypothetical protein HMPREF9501_01991 [Enterococcus faecalis TX0027]
MKTVNLTDKEASYLYNLLRNDTNRNQAIMKKNPTLKGFFCENNSLNGSIQRKISLSSKKAFEKGEREMGCKKNFVIKVSQNFGGGIEWYYYSGTTYTVQGEVFGNFVDDIRNAKDYTSKKRAENAMEKLKIKVWNWSNMMVIQK